MTSGFKFIATCFLSALFLFSSLNGHLAVAYSWNQPTATGTNGTNCTSCKINTHPDVSDLVGTSFIESVHAASLHSRRTYRYVHYLPCSQEKPTLFFLHGFPSSAFDWRRQFHYFSSRGYGVLAPDLLGYGGTDKPLDPEAYTLKKQAAELIELLDCVGAGKVVIVGHDLGSPVLSRIANYYPARSEKYVFLDVGYMAPGQLVTGERVEAAQDVVGYQIWFNEDGTGYVLDQHQDSLFSIVYTDDEPVYWKNDLSPTGALEAFLEADRRAPTGGFVSAEDEAIHNRIFAPERGGYEPSLNHYRAIFRNLNDADDEAIPASAANLTKPVLLLTASKDPVGSPQVAEGSTRPFAPDLTIQEIDSGHFLMLEKADEVNEAIRAFLERA